MDVNRDYETDNGSYATSSCEYVCIHYTGGAGRAAGETARANAQYYAREGGSIQCGASYFVGDDGVYASTPEGRGPWTQGNYAANHACVSIEVVAGDGEAFSDAEVAHLAELVPDVMARHGIPAERVIRHYDVADTFGGSTVDAHKCCPRAYCPNGGDPDGSRWAALRAMVTSGAAADPDVRYMQGIANLYLARFGQDGIAATGVYDDSSKFAVTRLVQCWMLAVGDPTLRVGDGETGQVWSCLNVMPVRSGMGNVAAWAVKAALVGCGYKGLDLTSWDFDARTVEQLRAFQADHGLAADGIATGDAVFALTH